MAQVRKLLYTLSSAVLLVACSTNPSTPPVSSTNAALTADIESSGSSGGVAGGELVPVNDVILTSDPGDPDTLVPSLALTGQANITGSFRASDFARVVENCSLYDDGDNLISSAVTPDASGRMAFTGLPVLVPAMGELRLGVRCDFDSALDNPSGELVTVGIADVVDIEAVGMDMGAVPVNVTEEAMREAGATGEDPMLGVPVAPAGDIVIEFDPAGPTGVIVPDGTLQLIASGTITATGEDIVLEQASIALAGDPASYDDIAVFIGGEEVGTAVASADASIDITLTGGMSILNRDVEQPLELRARLATLVPRSSVGSAAGTPVSGNRIALGFESVSGTGATSAAPCTSSSAPTTGNTLVARGGSLSIALQEVTDAMLFRGRSFTILRMTVTGRGELGRILLEFDRTMTPDFATMPPAYSFYGMTILRDGGAVDSATVTAEDGTDLRTAVYPFPDAGITRAWLSFPGGLAVDGTATIEVQMALQGDIVGTDILSIGIAASTATDTATGYLADDVAGSVGPRPSSSIDEGTDSGPGGTSASFVVAWSDVTDSPHNSLTASTGGSRDWINEYGLGDLSLRTIAVAP